MHIKIALIYLQSQIHYTKCKLCLFLETPPPPYCIFAMDRLKPEGKHNLQNIRNIFIFSEKLIIKHLKSHQPHDMFYRKKKSFILCCRCS